MIRKVSWRGWGASTEVEGGFGANSEVFRARDS